MHLDMKKVPDKDEVQITIYAEPIKILSIDNGYIHCEWEGRRWKMPTRQLMLEAILSPDTSEEIRDRFLARLNELLKQIGDEE